jgi:CRP/FNR family transcriptional regulator, cyclic AMP receptor protein
MRSYLESMTFLKPPKEDGQPTFNSVISKLSLFRQVGPEAQRDIAARLVMRHKVAGTLLMSQDEPSDTLIVIQRGQVKLVLFGEGGRQMTLGTLGPGEFFGEISAFDGRERGVSAIAVEDTTVLILARDELFEHLSRFPATAVSFLMEMSRRMRRQHELIASLALSDVGQRLAKTLVQLAREDGAEGEGGLILHRRPTQQELANMVGSCRETVSRALTGFPRRGLVQPRGRTLFLSAELLSLAA